MVVSVISAVDANATSMPFPSLPSISESSMTSAELPSAMTPLSSLSTTSTLKITAEALPMTSMPMSLPLTTLSAISAWDVAVTRRPESTLF